jgi:hypothetical protein
VFCGTANPSPILSQNVSSGCIGMLNADVIDLYTRLREYEDHCAAKLQNAPEYAPRDFR